MSVVRIALANVRVPRTPDDSVHLATTAVADARHQGASVICFPECFVPGYRWPGIPAPAPDPAFLERARTTFAERFPDPLHDTRDVMLAIGTKA